MARRYREGTGRTVLADGAVLVSVCDNGLMSCIPFAAVENCIIKGSLRRSGKVYVSNVADTYYTLPAWTKVRGRYVGGFLTSYHDTEKDFVSYYFWPYAKFVARVPCN